jgi:ATP-binding cassette subfamily B protein
MKTQRASVLRKTLKQLAEFLDISQNQLYLGLVCFYLITALGTICSGVGIIILVSVLGSIGGGVENPSLPESIYIQYRNFGIHPNITNMVISGIILFGLSAITTISTRSIEGRFAATIRRKVQKKIFNAYLKTEWIEIQKINAGYLVGTNTQEATLSAKYYNSIITAGYYVISATVFSIVGAYVDIGIFIVLSVILAPIMWLGRILMKKQSKSSKRLAELRNQFSADITDRVNGLLQIYTDERTFEHHKLRAMKTQDRMLEEEVRIADSQAILSSLNQIIPLIVFILLLILTVVGFGNFPDFISIASISLIGLRIISQISNSVVAIGNVARLRGSVIPVMNMLALKRKERKKDIPMKVVSIKMTDVGIRNSRMDKSELINCHFIKGMPNVIVGHSGSGKTTLANTLAGLINPKRGKIEYEDYEGNIYDSDIYRASVSYVLQDTYIFGDTIEDNIREGIEVDEKRIWNTLNRINASEFVEKSGGLDQVLLESGRGISGGQKKRLGIARALVKDFDILICDEISAGLDDKTKNIVRQLLIEISIEKIVIVITHEDWKFEDQNTVQIS